MKLCSYCNEPAERGGKTTAFCTYHVERWNYLDRLYGWKATSEIIERRWTKLRDVNFIED